MQVDRFYNSWVDSRSSVREWLERLCITTTATDRTKLLMEKHRLRNTRTRQGRISDILVSLNNVITCFPNRTTRIIGANPQLEFSIISNFFCVFMG